MFLKSIKKSSSDCFSFQLVTVKDICKEILILHVSNATQSEDKATKISKLILTFFLNILMQTLITLLNDGLFQRN